MKKLAMLAMGLTVMAGVSQAQLLRYEDFTPLSGAADGDLIGVTPDPLASTNEWAVSGSKFQAPKLSSGDLSYSGLQTGTTGFKAFLNNTNTSAAAGSSGNITMSYENQTGALYASFLLRVTDLGTLSTSWTVDSTFFHQYSTADSNIIGIRDNGAGGFELRFAGTSANFTAGTSAYTTGSLSLNTTYLVVVGTDNTASSGIWKVWINPTSFGGTEPTPTSIAAVWRGSAANNTALRLGDDDNNLPLPTMHMDDVRVGKTWADVTPVYVPPVGLVVIMK